MKSEKIHKNIQIKGSVQGVGFRFSARNAAYACQIKGFVKNMPDGDVYIEAEGPTYNLNKFLAWCHEGPASARIREVIVSDGPYKNFTNFDIKF